jgi:hypothetical protein
MMKINVLFSESWMYVVLRGEEVIYFFIFGKTAGINKKIRPCQKRKALYSNVFKFTVHEMKRNPM